MSAINITNTSDLFFIFHPFLHWPGYILYLKDIPCYARTTFSPVLLLSLLRVLLLSLLRVLLLSLLRVLLLSLLLPSLLVMVLVLPLPLLAPVSAALLAAGSPSMKNLQKM
jgi:hypothetical protein